MPWWAVWRSLEDHSRWEPNICSRYSQNGLCVSYLCSLFPDADFVYVKRNPGDNINSLIEEWKDGSNREKVERVLAKVETTACAMGYEL
jgi:hypothetical protein